MNTFMKGIKDGLPIGLGYLSVSFTFGIMAVNHGLYWWQAVLISMLTVTSAGQLAGIDIMIYPGCYIEMLVSQLTINIRYSFMSISLSQKLDSHFKGLSRWLFGFMMTDEIFAVASASEEKVTRRYFGGLCVLPYVGWTLGTLAGAILGNILPDRLMNALGIAIYGMFVAIVLPEMEKSKSVIFVVMVSIVFSCIFRFLPYLNKVSGGLAISICAVLAALLASLFFPICEKEEDT